MAWSEEEKREMWEDSQDQKRRDDFRKLKKLTPKLSAEEYLHWLKQINTIRKNVRQPSPVKYEKFLL